MEHGLRIGAVAQATGLPPTTLRYYEEIGLIPPPRRREHGYASHGHRLFTQDDIQRLTFIRRARLLNLSLDHIKELLASVPMGCCGAARPELKTFLEAKLQEVEQRFVELQALRHSLERLYADIARQTETCPPRATVAECVFGDRLVSLDCPSPSPPTSGRRKDHGPAATPQETPRQRTAQGPSARAPSHPGDSREQGAQHTP